MSHGDSDNNTNSSSRPTTASIEPVFARNNTLPAFIDKEYSTSELCSAVEKCSGFGSAIGAQRIGGLWRIYPATETARQKLLISGIVLRGVQVSMRGRNPFIVMSGDGGQTESQSTRLSIGNIPLSFSDTEILECVKALKCEPRSKLFSERDRDASGKLTRWLTGRRFLYITTPSTPLPKSVKIGPFTASLYHKEQRTLTRQKESECRRCFQKTHSTLQCPNPVKCRQCYQDNHKAGDPQCTLIAPLLSCDEFPSLPPPPPVSHPMSPPHPHRSLSACPVPILPSSQMEASGSTCAEQTMTVHDPTTSGKSPSPARGRSRSRKQRQEGSTQASALKQRILQFRRDSSSAKRGRSPHTADTMQKEKHARTGGDEAISPSPTSVTAQDSTSRQDDTDPS